MIVKLTQYKANYYSLKNLVTKYIVLRLNYVNLLIKLNICEMFIRQTNQIK